MKIYRTQAEVDNDIVDRVLEIDDHVRFEFSVVIAADIVAWNIMAWDITAWDIAARNIAAWNITAWDIAAADIVVWDITAWDIAARNITAGNIRFYAICTAYEHLSCKSIAAKRENGKYFCLDEEVKITG